MKVAAEAIRTDADPDRIDDIDVEQSDWAEVDLTVSVENVTEPATCLPVQLAGILSAQSVGLPSAQSGGFSLVHNDGLLLVQAAGSLSVQPDVAAKAASMKSKNKSYKKVKSDQWYQTND